MAKRSNQKLKLLYLSKILIENTNAHNAITMSQILRELDKYGIQAERRSIYDDIEALRIIGVDVQTTRDRYVKYYVAKNDFDLAELKLVFDLVSHSNLLDGNKSRELLKKMNAPMGNELFFSSDEAVSAYDGTAYKNLSIVCDAIYSDKKIRFKCFDWNAGKQKVVGFDGEYFILSPIRLQMKDGQYEVICFNDSTDSYESYRLARMFGLSVVNVKRPSDLPPLDSDRRLERVRLRCDNSRASDVFERFGLDVTVLSNREEWFEISVKTEISSSFFAWIFANEGSVKITEPEWVKNKFAQMIINNQKGNEEK